MTVKTGCGTDGALHSIISLHFNIYLLSTFPADMHGIVWNMECLHGWMDGEKMFHSSCEFLAIYETTLTSFHVKCINSMSDCAK